MLAYRSKYKKMSANRPNIGSTSYPVVIIPKSYFLRRYNWIHRDIYIIYIYNYIYISQIIQ